MSDIPEDVKAAAKECAATALWFLPFQARNFTAALEESYVNAILSERERAAKLAEGYRAEDRGHLGMAGREIASAIRGA